MTRNSSLILTWLVVAWLCTLGPSPAFSRDEQESEESGPADTVFYEIILTEEGVVAVDSAGYDWYYDFDRGLFVAGTPETDLGLPRPEDLENLPADQYRIEERCTEERRIGSFVPRAVIGYDEYVDGDIIAYGRVTIKGWVKGDVKSINKRVLVTGTGRVDGGIEAPEIIVRKGGVVLGEQIVTGMPLELEDITSSFSGAGMIIVLSFTLFFLFFGFLVVALMPRQLRNFNRCFHRYRLRTYVIGFLFIVMIPVLVTLVAITIVGIVLVPFVPLLYLFAVVLGLTSYSGIIGRGISDRFLGGEKGAMFQFVVGNLTLMTLWFVTAVLLGSSDDVSEGFGIAFLVVAIVISTYPVCSGIGAALLTRFGFREYTSWKDRQRHEGGSPTPAPPPIPSAPPISSSPDTAGCPDETSPAPPRKPD